MRCANKAATDADAQMRAAGEQESQDAAAGDSSPDDANKQPATPNVSGASGHPRAASPSAAHAAGICLMDVDPDIEDIHSVESDPLYNSKSPARSTRKAAVAETTTA